MLFVLSLGGFRPTLASWATKQIPGPDTKRHERQQSSKRERNAAWERELQGRAEIEKGVRINRATMVIRPQISSDTIAVSCGIEVHTGSPLLALCRRLLDEGCNPASPLEAYRGNTLCLTVRSIGEAAQLEVVGHRFTQAKRRSAASPISSIQPSTLAA